MRPLFTRLAAIIAAAAFACAPSPRGQLTMATTTSVGNSGLLDVLIPEYEQQAGITVQSHLVGSGRALAMLASGGADVVISHAPEAEAAALRAHPGWWYRKIMFNDFVIVGPPDDAAGVRGAASAADAMRRIAASEARFISRGDQSGTHEREWQLWTLAGAQPAAERLVTAGAGMGSTLRVASEVGAYTLADRATFSQHAVNLRLAILFEADTQLLNTYAVIAGDLSSRPGARVFGEWLVSGGGRDVIGRYRNAGDRPAFEPWPPGRTADRPEALPR